MKRNMLAVAAATVALASFVQAAPISLAPMTGFGGADGWYAPGENAVTYLTTDNNQRSLAYNPVTDRVYVVNGLSVRVLSPTTGDSVGLLDTTGITGGARALNTVGVTSDGIIYGTNLTTDSTASPFKVYRWATQGGVPTNTYSGNAGLPGARLGDGMGVGGTDANGYVASGYGNAPAVTGNNGFVTVTTGVAGTANAVGFTGTPPNAGDFRLSIAAVDGDTLFGTQSSGGSGRLRNVDFSGSTGTLVGSIQLSSASERAMDYAEYTYNAKTYKLLATIDTVSSLVRVYDVADVTGATTTLTPIASGNNTSGTLSGNGNASGGVAWGGLTSVDAYTANIALYAMSTNQGVQGFVLSVPEPASIAAIGGLALIAGRRRR